MMSILEEMISQNLIDGKVLSHLTSTIYPFSDIEKIQQLARQGLIDEDQCLAFFAQRYQIPLFSKSAVKLSAFPDQELCRQVFQETKILLVGIDEGYGGILSMYSDLLSLDKINFHIEASLSLFWSSSQQVDSFLQISGDQEWQLPEGSTLELTEHIFEKAIAQRCSDLHFETESDQFLVRFRVDGILSDAMKLPLDAKAPLLSRIKIIAGMDVAIQRRPQDGGYTYRAKNKELFDLRVSSIPTEKGEKLVVRLLDQSPTRFNLEALGFFAEDLDILRKACRMQSGLILVVGPTGSGKTTTLYSMLNEMNTRTKNIMTIEDPVEYHIPQINQVAVNAEQGLTFAGALRAFLRQDPDIILVGEIRDEETATVAIKAALTGHLVLSTLHSVDAVTTIQRLSNLGIESTLLADTLKIILSQRLVRRLCHHEIKDKECPRCRGTGYSGRVPVYEVLYVNKIINQRIKSGQLGMDLIQPNKDLFFHSFAKTSERLIEKRITDRSEIEKILMED